MNKAIDGLLAAGKPLNQMQVQFLGRASVVPWTHAHGSPKAVGQVTAGVDDLYRRWRQDPAAVWADKATWNPGWFGVGPAADAVRLMAGPLGPALDGPLDGQPRRAAWSDLFQASRDWLRVNRRWLTNQAMFTDTNLYLSDRAVAAIDPAHALPAEKAADYLYQCIGLAPWLGPDTPNGPDEPFGTAFRQVTVYGLTRERGYAGTYGEVGVEGAVDGLRRHPRWHRRGRPQGEGPTGQDGAGPRAVPLPHARRRRATRRCGWRRSSAGATRTSPATSPTPSGAVTAWPPPPPRSTPSPSGTPSRCWPTTSSSPPSPPT